MTKDNTPRNAAIFHVDSVFGSDENSGLTPEAPWKSLEKVNAADIRPGDTVLFKRGGLWRGQLFPHSGAAGFPVLYSNYGDGPLPILEHSVAAEDPALWTEVMPTVWKTAVAQPVSREPFPGEDFRSSTWKGTSDDSIANFSAINQDDGTGAITLRLEVAEAGTIRLWGPYIPKFQNDALILKLQLKASRNLILDDVAIRSETAPYAPRAAAISSVVAGETWNDCEAVLVRNENCKLDQPMRSCLTLRNLQAGDVLECRVTGTDVAVLGNGLRLPFDVGNVIFNHGDKPCGRKRWNTSTLEGDGDYYYSGSEKCVYMKSPANPATLYSSIEFALNGHIIDETNQHDMIFDGLALRYGASHGFGGGYTHHITIRNCDIYYIGGGHQFTHANGVPVRFGNGIEFWRTAHDHLVENNRIWEIYDAAMTNQGHAGWIGGRTTQRNITWRNNIVWNAEYSFEYWNGPKCEITENILLENNTFIDAGYGWAHTHRPNPNGGHLMFYGNVAKTSNFVIRNNIFFNSADVCMRMTLDWSKFYTLENNLWGSANGKPIIRFKPMDEPEIFYSAEQFQDFVKKTDRGANDIVAIPHFTDPEKHDYRLLPDSPGFDKNIGAR